MKLNARIGVIHIAADAICAALVKTGGMPAILQFQREKVLEPLPDMEATEVQVQALKKATEPFASQVESWVLCVNSSWSVARRLTIPFRGRSRVKPAVPFELEPHLAFPIEDVAVDYVVTEERPRETDVLAIAVSRSVLEAQLAVCRAAGITIEGIGLDVIGVTALFDQRYQNSADSHVLLHVFDENAALVVLRRRKLREFAMLPFGAHQLQQHPAETWRSIGNAVRSLETLERDADAPLRVHVCGLAPADGAETDDTLPGGVELVFEDQLIPALVAEDPSESRMHDIFAGCALTAAGGGVSLNFLDAELRAGQRPPGVARRVAVAAALAAVLFVLFLSFRYAEYRANAARVEALGQEIHQIYADTFPTHDGAQARPPGDIGGFKSFEAMQLAADEEVESRAAFSPDVFKRPTLLDLLLDISRRMPANAVTITDMKISTGRNNEVTLYGQAQTSQALNVLLRNLRDSEVMTMDERRLTRSSAGGRETFEIVARF